MKFLLPFLLLTIALPATAETVDTLLCPRSIDKFVETSKSTFFTMEDLVKSKNQLRQAYEDLYYFMLDKNKSKSLLEEIKGIDTTISGIKTKEKRAEDNYNKTALEMGSYLTKTRRCWSSVPKEKKQQVNMLFDYILKEKRLTTFKECVQAMEATNVVARKKYNLAQDFMNKRKTEKDVVAAGKVNADELKRLKEKEQNTCKGMNKESYYKDFVSLYFLNFVKEPPK